MKISKKNATLLLSVLVVFVFAVFDIEIDDKGSDVVNEDVNEGLFVVSRVIDGDTFEIESGQRVRMIGIDTPERGKYFFTEATDRLKELIEGKEVTLSKDVSEVDRYGRLLRHVYVKDNWINKQMIDEGYAKLATFPPDVLHVDVFEKSQKNAREQKKGLWDK
ncbi:MAG: thermonuclease family protein [Patescibacteria group bacterium]